MNTRDQPKLITPLGLDSKVCPEQEWFLNILERVVWAAVSSNLSSPHKRNLFLMDWDWWSHSIKSAVSNILPSPPLPIILIRIPERMLFAKRHELRVNGGGRGAPFVFCGWKRSRGDTWQKWSADNWKWKSSEMNQNAKRIASHFLHLILAWVAVNSALVSYGAGTEV